MKNYKNNLRLLQKLLSVVSIILISISMAHASSSKISARSAYIMDSTSGKVLYSKNPDLKQPPASTTKLVTAMTALDRLELDQVVEVSYHAANIYPSHKRLRKGDKYTVRSLLNLALMSSVNSAAVALAEASGGSEPVFVILMNKKAESIGALNTRYINATGLPGNGQYITAKDLALIMEAALKYPEIREIIHTKVREVRAVKGLTLSAVNTNKLLWSGQRILGGKTGYTNKALNCLAFAVKKDDSTLVAAVLGDSKRSWLWRSAKQLVLKADRSGDSDNLVENTIEDTGDDTEAIEDVHKLTAKKSHHKRHKKFKTVAREKHKKFKTVARDKRKKAETLAKKELKTSTRKAHLDESLRMDIVSNKD